jgi:hypothetical protein
MLLLHKIPKDNITNANGQKATHSKIVAHSGGPQNALSGLNDALSDLVSVGGS